MKIGPYTGITAEKIKREYVDGRRNFSKVKIITYDFSGVEFENVDFRWTDLSCASFEAAVLKNVDFSNAKLINCKFISSDLSWSIFNKAYFENVDMRNANLSYAVALNTNIRDGAKLGGAITSTFAENEADFAKLQNDELATAELMNISNNVPSGVLFTIMHNVNKLEEKLRSVGSTINHGISNAYGSFKSFLGFGTYGGRAESEGGVYRNASFGESASYTTSIPQGVYVNTETGQTKYGNHAHKKVY